MLLKWFLLYLKKKRKKNTNRWSLSVHLDMFAEKIWVELIHWFVKWFSGKIFLQYCQNGQSGVKREIVQYHRRLNVTEIDVKLMQHTKKRRRKTAAEQKERNKLHKVKNNIFKNERNRSRKLNCDKYTSQVHFMFELNYRRIWKHNRFEWREKIIISKFNSFILFFFLAVLFVKSKTNGSRKKHKTFFYYNFFFSQNYSLHEHFIFVL